MSQEYDPESPLPEQDDAPSQPSRRRLFGGLAALGVAGALPAAQAATTTSAANAKPHMHSGSLDERLRARVKNVVVIYLENRSFNNLFADFPGLRSPLSQLTSEQYSQVDRNGQKLSELPKIWAGLVQRSQTLAGKTYQIGENKITGLANAPFPLKDAEGAPLPEAVITRDLVHAFYQNQMQINGGKNDSFAAWGDSGALVMGYYAETRKNLNLWNIARQYTLCDNFFMGAFGGSWLNHQYLIASRTPVYPDAANSVAKGKIAALTDGPLGKTLAVKESSPASALDGVPAFVNPGSITPDNFAVNTMAPPYQPSFVSPAPEGDKALANPADPAVLPPQDYKTIGDLLSAKKVSWAWYGGGWQAALNGRGGPDSPNFQYHHQPFNYFKQFAPGTAARAEHLRDGGLGDSPISNRFIADIVAGKLPAVSFYKPQGNLNMHAGYSDVESGDRHVANILAHLQNGPQWKDSVVFITFDENGGWWDHVAPPEGDRWGPGSRIPALVVSPHARKGHVDHTFYDTTSYLRFITRLHGLPTLEGIAERNAAFKARGSTPPGDMTASLDL